MATVKYVLLQADGTQQSIIKNLDTIVKGRIQLGVVWLGPFIASVACFRPDTIKAILKGIHMAVCLHRVIL